MTPASGFGRNDGSLMIGMVLVTHGQLATGFRAALEHVVGPQAQVETIAIGPEDDMEQRRSDILNAAARVQDGSGVVILTDMFGGTPSNLAISVMEGGRVEVICGINLPMLIKLATLREGSDLDHAVVEARDAGRKYITIASKVLAGK
jgi:mannose PTS system EIIA component